MKVSDRDGVRGLRRVALAVLSVVVLASAMTIGGAQSAAAVGATAVWYYGPNAPDELANQTTYFGVPFTPYFYGVDIPLTFPGEGGFSYRGTSYPGLWAAVVNERTTVTYSTDLPGATITEDYITGPGGGPGIIVRCASDTCAAGLSSFRVQLTYSGVYRSQACIREFQNGGTGTLEAACPTQLVQGTQTRIVVAGREPTDENFQPTAAFNSTQSSTDRFEWSFTSRASDDRDAASNLDHEWDFGDGTTSDEMDPTHRFDTAGEHEVTLTVTDSGGLSASSSEVITISSGLVVNSTGDGSALDPTVRGCDTGATVDDDAPECTLRAAIETAEELGGGEISFDIAGGGLPTIAAATALPAITTSVTIDGTTQEGGHVGLSGGGEALLTLAGGTSRVAGLVIEEATDAVTVTGGSGHVVEGNSFGTDAAGAAEGTLRFGIVATGSSGLLVSDNVFVVDEGGIVVGPDAPGAQFVGNTVGANAAGTSSLGDPTSAVLIAGPDAEVRGNLLRGQTAGVAVVGAAATGVTVVGNTVGLNRAGTAPLDDMGYGIRVDGAPGTRISDNNVWSPGWAAILVSGTLQVESGDDSTYTLVSPGAEIEDLAVTGGSATITGNTIGLVSGNQTAEPAIQRGVYTWSGADDVTVSDNTIAGATDTAVELETGARHTITGNRIGTDTSGATAVPVRVGVSLFDTSDVTIGDTGSDGNTIVAEVNAVEIGDTATVSVAGNSIAGADGSVGFIGAYVDATSTGATLSANVVTNGGTGIRNDSDGATITGNTVREFVDVGIRSRGDDTTVTGNVSSANGAGIAASGQDLTISLNRVGSEGATDTVLGNTGTGIEIGEDSVAVLTRNIVAGSGAQGIDVADGSTATLRSNQIRSSAGKAIDAPSAPDAPNLAAALRSTSGTSTRTTLLLTDLPEGDAGTLEVFANDSCSDPEAEVVTDIIRTKKAADQVRIIQVVGAVSRDNYTVTYTDESGRTSELSSCASATVYGDADGDGSQDPLDEVFDLEDDPTRAVIAADNEELLWIGVQGDGELSDISVVDDPAPGTHPAGWSLPYGTISFRVTGLAPGAATAVSMTTITGASPVAGTSYWKYGPPTPGAEERWYQFSYDPATETGARLTAAQDIPGLGIRSSFVLDLRDGARGDNDGGANGTITDPGGPVIGGDIDAAAPAVSPPPPVAQPLDPVPTPSDAGAVAVGGSSPGGVPAAAVASSASPGGLPYTGGSPWRLLLLGAALVLAGGFFVEGRRRVAGTHR